MFAVLSLLGVILCCVRKLLCCSIQLQLSRKLHLRSLILSSKSVFVLFRSLLLSQIKKLHGKFVFLRFTCQLIKSYALSNFGCYKLKTRFSP